MEGLDEIGLTLARDTRDFEHTRSRRRPSLAPLDRMWERRMKALLSQAPGGPEHSNRSSIADPVARPGPGAGRGQGLRDQLSRRPDHRGQIPVQAAAPFAPGGEIAGVVEAVGEGVDGWARRRPRGRA